MTAYEQIYAFLEAAAEADNAESAFYYTAMAEKQMDRVKDEVNRNIGQANAAIHRRFHV